MFDIARSCDQSPCRGCDLAKKDKNDCLGSCEAIKEYQDRIHRNSFRDYSGRGLGTATSFARSNGSTKRAL